MVEVKCDRAKRMVRGLVSKTNVVPCLWGKPGIGKSDIVYQVAKELEWDIIEIRLGLMDPTDLKGLPYIKDGKAIWVSLGELPDQDDKNHGILFCDEMPQAAPAVQGAASQLLLNHRIGEYHLPEKWKIVIAGNPAGTGNVSFQMPVLIRNRVAHLDVVEDLEAWKAWAWQHEVDDRIISFLNFRQELLYKFTGKENAFPTPRSWAKCSIALKALGDDGDLDELVASIVGDGPAAEFTAHLDVASKLPSLDKIFAGENIVPKDESVCYALLGALVSECKKRGVKTVERMFDYAMHLDAEYSVLLIKDLARAVGKEDVRGAKGAIKWAEKHKDVVL